MENVIMEIGDLIVPKKNPVDTYRLHVRSMSGDADAYNTHTIDFDTALEVVKHVQLFDGFFELSWNEACDEDIVIEAIEKRGKELDFEFALDFYQDMVGNDITNHNMASPSELWATWFDENAREHKMTINGKNKVYRK
jgi:hypothetical protein